jgi:hypothetical protein
MAAAADGLHGPFYRALLMRHAWRPFIIVTSRILIRHALIHHARAGRLIVADANA